MTGARTGRGSRLRPFAPWLLVVGLLVLALWRGHVLIEQGSRPLPPPAPSPEPAPDPVTFIVTVERMTSQDGETLCRRLAPHHCVPCPAGTLAGDPFATLVSVVIERAGEPDGSAPVPRPFAAFLSTRPGLPRLAVLQDVPGVHLLARAEAEELVAAARLAVRSPAPPAVVWLHLRDLATPPPRPGRTLRWLRRHGWNPPSAPVLRDWLERPGRATPDATRAFNAYRASRLDAVARALGSLLEGAPGPPPRCLIVADTAAGHGRGQTPSPFAFAIPGGGYGGVGPCAAIAAGVGLVAGAD